MKVYILIHGDNNYYPSASAGDWKSIHRTYEEALLKAKEYESKTDVYQAGWLSVVEVDTENLSFDEKSMRIIN